MCSFVLFVPLRGLQWSSEETKSRLLVFPLRNTTWCPGRTRRLQLFLQLCQIYFNQLMQLDQYRFKLLRRHLVLVHLSLRWTRNRHALRTDNVGDTLTSRWRCVHIALARCCVAAQFA